MKCQNKKCNGDIDLGKPAQLEITPFSRPGEILNVYPCKRCGWLHWTNGTGVMMITFYGFSRHVGKQND